MATSAEKNRERGPWQRVPGADLSTAEAVFKAAMSLIVPEDQTQRKAFETLMPYMYVLRNKGCSFEQITKLLTDCGFRLQPSTVRSYYSELLATRLDICQERMNEQILVMSEVRKETQGADMSAIHALVAAKIEQDRAASATKVGEMFGVAGAGSRSASGARGTATPSHVKAETTSTSAAEALASAKNKKAGLRPAPVEKTTSDSAVGSDGRKEGIGHLNLKISQQKNTLSPRFFDNDDAPVVPDLNSKPKTTTTTQDRTPTRAAASPHIEKQPVSTNEQLRCMPLHQGIKPIKKRDNVPKELYLPGKMEHPCIPGLMLTQDERVYGAALELANLDTGEIRLETMEEKRFRGRWTIPIPPTIVESGKNFIKIDESLFPGPAGRKSN